MCIFISIAVFVIGCLILKRSLDRETVSNLSFLCKVSIVIMGILVILGMILTIFQT